MEIIKDGGILSDGVIVADMEDIFHRDIPLQELYGKTILISGATGMLASYVVYFLVWLNETKQANINIIALARNQQKCRNRFGKYLEREYFKLHMDNILEPLNIYGDIDYIVHAASLASPQYYGTNPVDVAAPNVIGTYNLLELARHKRVKGFLYFSSGDVYGKMPDGIGEFSEDEMGTTDPLISHSCYSESKRMGETFCASFYRQYGVPTTIARIGHTYGPTMDISNDPRVFSSFMKNVYEGNDIVMRSDGTTKRPFCYIADGVAAYLQILLRGEPGNAYNVCNADQFISMNELAQVMVNIRQDVNLRVVHKCMKEFSKYVENKDNIANCPSSARLEKLGWECHFDVKDGFSRVYRFLKGNCMNNLYIRKERLRCACPVCGETEKLEEIFFRDFSGAAGIVPFLSYKVYGCQKCGLMYAGRLEESQNIGAYYTKMSRYEGNSFVLSEKVKSFYARVAKFLVSQVSKNSRVLDIGCAFGGQLAALKEQGFTSLFGLEPSEKNAQYAMDNYGIKVFNGGLGMGFKPTDKYDLVILSGVLEHLVELHNAIDEIKGFLNTGGKLFLVVPDLDDFANHSDLYQEFSVEHINYFNVSSLSYLLGRHGFILNSSVRDNVALHGLCRNMLALFELGDGASQEFDASSSFDAMKKYLQVGKQVENSIATKMKNYSFEQGCYIWGAGTQTQMLFQLGIVKQSDVRLVIDANPNYHGEEFYGTHIVTPDVLLEIETLPILISSQYAQDAIEQQIREMKLNNMVYKLF